ncbi:Succinate-semialdehyde dehydrogenase, partial [Geodia barretti]
RCRRACDAAAAAQPGWAATAPLVRSEILRDCHRILIEHTDELADLITLEHGKPRADAVGEVAYAAEFFRWNAEETVRIHGTISTAPSGDKRIITRHPPVGVVVMITPWNFPAGDDHPQAGPRAGRGQRGGDQAAPGGAPHRAARRRAAGHRRSAARRRQPGPHHRLGPLVRRRGGPSGRAHGVVHRLHRGGTDAAAPLRRPGPQDGDGAGRQRSLRRVRRRRPGGGHLRGHGGQDAPLGRDLHRGQQVLRGGAGVRRVRGAPGRGHGGAEGGQRLRPRRHLRTDDQLRRGGQHRQARAGGDQRRGQRSHRRLGHRRAGFFYEPTVLGGWMWPRPSPARRSSDRWRR